MAEPGWYYADGDPVGTVRYWDGAAWRGAAMHQQPIRQQPIQQQQAHQQPIQQQAHQQPTTHSAGQHTPAQAQPRSVAEEHDGIAYYTTEGTQLDLTGAATQASRANVNNAVANSYTLSPYSVSKASSAVTRVRVPPGVRSLATFVGILYLLWLATFAVMMAQISPQRINVGLRNTTAAEFLPGGPEIGSGTVALAVAVLVFTALLVFVQTRSALRGNASLLGSAALVLSLIMLCCTAAMWLDGRQTYVPTFMTVIVVAQVALTAWTLMLKPSRSSASQKG